MDTPEASIEHIDSSKGIREGRFLREFAKEEDIYATGVPNKELNGILNHVNDLTSDLEEKNQGWIDKKRTELSQYLSPISEEELREKFNNGLKRSLMLQYRLTRKISSGELENFHNDEYLTEAIKAYTYEFILSLRHSQDLGLEPTMAIRLAEKTYSHDSDTVLKLRKEFPHFEPWVITSMVVNNRNPREFLENLDKSISVLSEEFPEFTKAEITRIAVGWPDSAEDHLHGIRDSLPGLEKDFSEFDPYEIRQVTISRTDPRTVLEEARKKLPELRERFSSLPESLLTTALIKYPKSPTDFLTNVETNLAELSQSYPDLERHILIAAAQKKNPQVYIQDLQKEAAELKTLFPDFDNFIIERACIDYAEPQERLTYCFKAIAELSPDFPDLPPSIITHVVTRYSDPRSRLVDIQKGITELSPDFPDIPLSVVIKIVTTRNDARGMLENIQTNLPSLLEQFPLLSRDEVLDIMEANTDYETRLKNISTQLPEYQHSYPQFPNWVIKKAVITHSDPKTYLESLSKRVAELSKAFPNYAPSTILQVAVEQPSDGLNFLQHAQDVIPELRLKFPNVELWILEHAAVTSPTKAESIVERALKGYEKLKEKYPDATDRALYYAAMDRPNNPGSYLAWRK